MNDRRTDEQRALLHRAAALHLYRGRTGRSTGIRSTTPTWLRCPSATRFERELRENRDAQLKLIENELPEIGACKFADYFSAALGATLYNKFMANYTWKMWNIPGDELETSMVWADRFQSEKGAPTTTKVTGYDPLKFDDHTLGKGIRFQVYPKHGWNAVWDAMVARNTVVRDSIVGIRDEHRKPYVLTATGERYYFADYHTVFNSIDIDRLWGEDTLPYTGRMMIPLLIPGLACAFPERAESLHYSSCEFQTRVTEMKAITRHESADTLILIEVPVLPGAAAAFRKTPSNTRRSTTCSRRRPTRSSPSRRSRPIGRTSSAGRNRNLRHVGRHAEFKYWGMAETVNSAYEKSLEFRARVMSGVDDPPVDHLAQARAAAAHTRGFCEAGADGNRPEPESHHRGQRRPCISRARDNGERAAGTHGFWWMVRLLRRGPGRQIDAPFRRPAGRARAPFRSQSTAVVFRTTPD